MSFTERREGSDRRAQGDRRDAGQDLYERLKEKRIEIERERREGPRRRHADRRTTKDPHPDSSNFGDEAQPGAERAVKNAG
jgi:hypothetical protein